jgi:site-specific DNA recombinase
MNPNTYRYFIYVRKSTESEERQVRSIGDQLAELRDLVAKDELNVVDMLAESQSAKTKGRPIFNDMLDRIEKGEADGIIAWHPDRLARNAFDGGRVIDLIDEGKLKDLRFSTFWFETTAQGKLMLNLAFGQSKYYSDNLSDNIRRSQRRKVSEGVWAWKAPVGYLNEPTLRTIVIDPIKGPLITKTFELYATGKYSMDMLREKLSDMGLRGPSGILMAPSSYQALLNNPFYYGLFRLHGELHEGTHPPLVSKKLFDECQAVMKKRSKPSSDRLKFYIYRGLLHCGECGCVITMETQKGHNYLRCTKRIKKDCSQPYLREEKVSDIIAAVLTAASLPDDTADWIVAELEQERLTESGASEAVKSSVGTELKQLDRKIDRLTAAYLEKDAFTPSEFRSRKKEFLDGKRLLQEKLAVLESESVKRFEPLISFVNRSKQAKYVANRFQPLEMRAELENIGSNLKLLDRKLEWEPRGAWKLVVAQGSLAHRNPARSHDRAGLAGESHLMPGKWAIQDSNL